ncbi:unnamed protein product [Musa hybrid cultivar]
MRFIIPPHHYNCTERSENRVHNYGESALHAVRIITGIVFLLVIIVVIGLPPFTCLGSPFAVRPVNNPGQQRIPRRTRSYPLRSPRIFSFLLGCFPPFASQRPPFATRDTHPPVVIKQSPIDGRLRGREVQQPKAVGWLQRELRLSPSSSSSSSLVFPCNRSRWCWLDQDQQLMAES